MTGMTFLKRTSIAFAAVLMVLAAVAAPRPASAEALNRTDKGVLIHGMDPVAYFTDGKPVQGSALYTAEYDGAEVRFSSPANRDAFTADPERYMPAYGGYCSYGVRHGKKFDIDPDAWAIVDGRLFLQLDHGTQLIWKQETEENIAIADRLWPQLEPMPADVLSE